MSKNRLFEKGEIIVSKYVRMVGNEVIPDASVYRVKEAFSIPTWDIDPIIDHYEDYLEKISYKEI